MIDLDRFKPLNDTFGHPFGDEILQIVGARLEAAVRHDDLVARIGGDEFAIIMINAGEPQVACELAGRIVEVLAAPFVIDGKIADLGASVGIAMAPVHGSDDETLVQHADIALYTAKRGGRSRTCLFEAGLIEGLQRRRFIEGELRGACARNDFTVMYQPVIDPQSGKFTGAEALVRWTCRDRGNVPPAEFIPIAEELGLIGRIGAFVLRQACADAASWPAEIGVAVNLSPVQLLDPDLVDLVEQTLSNSGLAPGRLELEITETALLGDDEAALRVLRELTALGVRISLDDFGTGYSSLSYLHRFPISRIKIDKSFVQQLPGDAGSASIVKAIAQLGENLNMQITAEGIETDEQLEFIAQYGCGHVQGFLISHPVRSEAVSDLFRNSGIRTAA
jgi:diguanylate cyclase (GGDEF)-like protein